MTTDFGSIVSDKLVLIGEIRISLMIDGLSMKLSNYIPHQIL